MNSGNLIWSKTNLNPFNSQVKIYQDKFYVIDFENVLRCISVKSGKELWNYKTEKSFIKSQQKLSFIINNNKLVFINTLGDLSSVDIKSGDLLVSPSILQFNKELSLLILLEVDTIA